MAIVAAIHMEENDSSTGKYAVYITTVINIGLIVGMRLVGQPSDRHGPAADRIIVLTLYAPFMKFCTENVPYAYMR